MATKSDDPRLKAYAAKSREGTTNLTRTAARSDEARKASKTTWDEQWVGVIKNYPKTEEAFEAKKAQGRASFAKMREEGRPPTRLGVPDGWAGRKQEIAVVKAAAAVKASEAITGLIVMGHLSMDEQAGNAALRVAYEFIFDETLKPDTRLKAIKIVADFVKPRPTQTVKVEVSEAERWLASIADLNVTDVDEDA